MMKRLVKGVLNYVVAVLGWLAYLWSFVYNQRLKYFLDDVYSKLYYMWVKRLFGKIGKVHFLPPAYIVGAKFITIDDGTVVGCRAMICAHKMANVNYNSCIAFKWNNSMSYVNDDRDPEIIIGKNCYVGDDCNIQCCNSIRLGNGILMGRKVMINDSSHGEFVREQLGIQPGLRPLCSKGPIVIDDNVWIGEMVCILGGVHIGRGSVIGAGAVVTKDIPAYSLAVGSPAKVIRRFEK